MRSVRQIFTIARFEIKTLLRSWFFRIFAFIGIFIITIFNIAMLLAEGPRWQMRAIPTVIPYSNIMMLNIAQSVIIAFLATEFMKRDKKLDTTEVIYIRSMSNGVYILGKSLGTLFIFLLLNLFVLLVTGVINGLMEGVQINLVSYLVYPLIMSIPALVFILGLSYVLMLTLRNQAVTFVVLLGYIATCLFYLRDKFNFVFDFMSFSLPAFMSDMVGIPQLDQVLMQRGIYLSLGLGFIFLTILMIGRLRQSKAMTGSSIALSVIFIAGGVALALNYLQLQQGSALEREELRMLEKEYVVKNNPEIAEYEIKLDHKGDMIAANVQMKLENGSEPLNDFFLVLNPGLRVTELSVEGTSSEWSRKGHIISVNNPLDPQEEVTVNLSYEGTIDQDAMYLDIDEETRDINYRVALYSVGKQYSFLQPDYVLLTPEAAWYPRTRIAFNNEMSIMNPVQFSDYKLEVKTLPGLTAISQGGREEISEGNFRFHPEYPLPQVSLIIGDYSERSIMVDSIEYRLSMRSDHFYFDDYFPTIADTLENTLREIKNEFELELELDYPYKRFGVVEVPAMFVSYPRIFSVAKEVMQPEMSLLPEKGMTLFNADFAFRKERLEQRNEQRGNEFTEQELEARLLQQFITSTLTISNQNNFFTSDEAAIFTNTYSIFPSYYSYTNYMESESWAFFNKAFESFLWTRVSPPSRGRWNSATTVEEDANIALSEKTFSEIVREGDDELVNSVISLQGNYIFSSIKADIGEEIFNESLKETISDNRFRSINVPTLETGILGSEAAVIPNLIEGTLNSTKMPGFLISNVEAYSFKDGDRTRYAVVFDVENTREQSGLINVGVRVGGQGRGGRGGGDFDFGGGFGGMGRGGDQNMVERLFKLGALEKSRVQMVLEEEPRNLRVNTMLSINLPSIVTYPFSETRESERTFEEQLTVIEGGSYVAENEYIVDDEDEGFTATKGQEVTPLRALILGEQIDNEDKYSPMGWRRPGRWTQTISPWAYGNEVRSAYYVGSGDGTEVATWSADLEEAGYYDVYVYLNNRMRWGRRDGEIEDDYHYTVHSDEGPSEITVEIKNIENGWNSLGSFYMSSGKVRVELTNESKGRTVVADAVKWVKR